MTRSIEVQFTSIECLQLYRLCSAFQSARNLDEGEQIGSGEAATRDRQAFKISKRIENLATSKTRDDSGNLRLTWGDGEDWLSPPVMFKYSERLACLFPLKASINPKGALYQVASVQGSSWAIAEKLKIDKEIAKSLKISDAKEILLEDDKEPELEEGVVARVSENGV